MSIHGIAGKELNWFIDYLFHQKQYVYFNNALSNVCEITWRTLGIYTRTFIVSLTIHQHRPFSHIIKYAEDTITYVGNREFTIHKKLR